MRERKDKHTTYLGEINFITLLERFSTNDTCTKFVELLSHIVQTLNIKSHFLKKNWDVKSF